MSIYIQNSEVESLLDQVVQITGESEIQAIKIALQERRQRLATRYSFASSTTRTLLSFLQEEIWSQIPQDKLGISITKAEKENILGLGK